MAVKSVAIQELLDELLRNTERFIEIIVKREQNIECTNLPLFTKRERSNYIDKRVIRIQDQSSKQENKGFSSVFYCNLSYLPHKKTSLKNQFTSKESIFLFNYLV